MQTAALALLLASAVGADAPPLAAPAVEEIEELPDLPVPPRPDRGGLRLALGAGMLQDTTGVAPLLDAGYAWDPWPRMGFRLDLGLAVGTGWAALQGGPTFVIRGSGPGAFLTPYAAVGAVVAALGVNDRLGSGTGQVGQPQVAGGGRAVPAAASSGSGEPTGGGGDHPLNDGGIPFRFSYGPQAGGGLLLRLASDLSLDVAVRYELRVQGGRARSGGGATFGLLSAF